MKSKKEKQKSNSLFLIIGLLLIGVTTYLIFIPKSGMAFETILPSFYYDTSTKEKAVGASDYVFIAKINRILRVEHEKIIEDDGLVEFNPYTIYSITVIKNIKGILPTKSEIEIKFWGGLHRDETKYIYVEDLEAFKYDNYYILLPYLTEDNGPLIINNPDQAIRIGDVYNLKTKNETVEEYIKAYKNEEVPSEAHYMILKLRYYSIYDESRKH